jgi:hypothetical protein
VQVSHTPQKSEWQPFWDDCIYRIKNYDVEVTFNSMTSQLNFIEIYLLVQTLLGGTHTDRTVALAHIFPLGRKVGLQEKCELQRSRITLSAAYAGAAHVDRLSHV